MPYPSIELTQSIKVALRRHHPAADRHCPGCTGKTRSWSPWLARNAASPHALFIEMVIAASITATPASRHGSPVRKRRSSGLPVRSRHCNPRRCRTLGIRSTSLRHHFRAWGPHSCAAQFDCSGSRGSPEAWDLTVSRSETRSGSSSKPTATSVWILVVDAGMRAGLARWDLHTLNLLDDGVRPSPDQPWLDFRSTGRRVSGEQPGPPSLPVTWHWCASRASSSRDQWYTNRISCFGSRSWRPSDGYTSAVIDPRWVTVDLGGWNREMDANADLEALAFSRGPHCPCPGNGTADASAW